MQGRSAVFAALAEPARLAIVDLLAPGDSSPGELATALGMPTNLFAHHVRVLEEAGVVRRVRSEGDRRRSYVQLSVDNPTVWAAALAGRVPMGGTFPAARVLFVCTANSARSQLAAAQWNQVSSVPAASAGTHPGPCVHPRAVAAGRRHGIKLEGRWPMNVADVLREDDLIVAVCDNAYEELGSDIPALHWSIPDPAGADTDQAFEDAYIEVSRRVHYFANLYAS